LQGPNGVGASGSGPNTPENLLMTVKQRLAQCKLCVIEPRTKASDDELASRRRADGFIINGVTYIKHHRLNAWLPKKSDRAVLRRAGIFHTKRLDTSTVEKKIAGIKGKPRYCAIKADVRDRSSE
jgi:hypothetical protein